MSSVILGDCVDVMATMDADSFDAIVTDPPYGLEFMGRTWDRFDGEMVDPAFLHWFAGFVDGEGCFSVHKKPQNTYDCQFSITLRADDKAILERIQRTLGMGTVADANRHGPDNPKARYCVSSKRDCSALRDLFRAFPLRAKKAHDFEIWSEALDAWLNHERGEWEDMAEPRDRLMASRAYKPEGVRVDPYQMWTRRWAAEAYRILKPGGHLLAFGGTRTSHRLVAGLEDADFEIRDTLVWAYASGFPKSLDVSKAIDKAAGAEREITGSDSRPAYDSAYAKWDKPYEKRSKRFAQGEWDLTAPATDAAKRWQGWGTALKPAWEPIVLARKPLQGTVAANVQRYNVGAINIDGCRIGTDAEYLADGEGGRSSEDGQGSGDLDLPGVRAGVLNDPSSSGEGQEAEDVRGRMPLGFDERGGESQLQAGLHGLQVGLSDGDGWSEGKAAIPTGTSDRDGKGARSTVDDQRARPSHQRDQARQQTRKPRTSGDGGPLEDAPRSAGGTGEAPQGERDPSTTAKGRWPSNLILTDAELFDVRNDGVVGSGADAGGGYGTRGSYEGSLYEGGWKSNGFQCACPGGGGYWSRKVHLPGCISVNTYHGRMPERVGYGDTGGYARFFLVPKSSRSDREPVLRDYALALHRESGECDKLGVWGNEDRSQPEQTVSTSPGRATSEATGTGSSPSVTSQRGKQPTGRSRLDTRSTTSTETRPTTDSPTSSSSIPSPTNGSTPAVSSEMESGGNPATSAGNSSLWTESIGISVERDGLSTDGAGPAGSGRSSGRNRCGRCGKPLPRFSTHPTQKPTDLMRHLVRLVTPQGGHILDPFAGSGTTGVAAILEGFDFTLIEREAEYVAIAEARLNGVQQGIGL